MRVGQVSEGMGVKAGGTASAFMNTLQALRTQPAVALRAFSVPADSEDPSTEDVRRHPEEWVLTSSFGRGLRSGELGRVACQHIREGALDLVHIHGLWSPDLRDVGLACIKAGVPCLWQPHGMLLREALGQKRLKKSAFMAMGLGKALRRASGLIFVTKHERASSAVPSGIGLERQHVVPLPVVMPSMTFGVGERAEARKQFGLPPDVPVIVFMGRLHPVKRVDMAIDAIASAECMAMGVRLLVVGGGELEADLRNHARMRGVEDRVLFAGWASGDKKWSALAAGDCLTLNSKHENFGFVAVEALCVGTLPVMTDNLSLAEELRTEGLAVVTAHTAESLARGYLDALALVRAGTLGGGNDESLVERGNRFVSRTLSPEAIGANLVALYSSVVRQAGVAARGGGAA